MAAFATTNTTNTSNTKMEPTTFLDAIRAEGAAADVNRMGFNYIMAREGTFADFKSGNIRFIRRAQSPGKGGRKGQKEERAEAYVELDVVDGDLLGVEGLLGRQQLLLRAALQVVLTAVPRQAVVAGVGVTVV